MSASVETIPTKGKFLAILLLLGGAITLAFILYEAFSGLNALRLYWAKQAYQECPDRGGTITEPSYGGYTCVGINVAKPR